MVTLTIDIFNNINSFNQVKENVNMNKIKYQCNSVTLDTYTKEHNFNLKIYIL